VHFNAEPIRQGVVQVGGVRSPTLEAGPPTADEAVVFVHGSPGSSRDWEEFIGAVGKYGRAVAIDMPGFGRADKPDHFDYTVEGYARHLGDCLVELGVRRAHLVLHDFGGPWGLEWGVGHPDAFASATLINTGIWPDYRWHVYARIWRTPVLGEIFMAMVKRPGFRMAVQRTNPRLASKFIDRLYDDYDRGTRRAILRLYRATDDPSRLGHEHAESLCPLGRPALVIWGKRDGYLPVWLAERQRTAFPAARVILLENSGHWPMVDDPSSVRTALLPFIREQLGGG
jgi:pimeloyl-ACP methyl ester carboxylesterase